MLPILDEEIDAAKVSIFNERVHATRPLQGLKIKNKTKQALMSGPVTVFEGATPYRIANSRNGALRTTTTSARR